MNLEAATFIFIYMYPTFVFELLLAEGLLLRNSPKRPYFAAWLIGGLMTLVGVVMGVSCLQALLGAGALVNAIGYILVFLFTLVIYHRCFDVPFKILLFFGAGAYALQNGCYRIISLLEISGLLGQMMLVMDYNWAEFILQVGTFIVCILLFSYFFVRKVNDIGMESIYSGNILVLSLITLSITVVLCSVTNAYAWTSIPLSIVSFCFSVIGDFFILWIQSGMLEKIALKSDIEEVKMLWQQDRRQYEIAKETVDLINIKCHDMKHKIKAMGLGEEKLSAEEVAEIESYISVYDSKVNTGCTPIDVLLTEKSLLCNSNGIHLSCMVDGSSLGFMRDYDLYSLFGNILTNAIEAVQKLSDENRRVIDLTVKNCSGMVIVNCINYYDGELKLVGGLPATSKTGGEHGYGLKSIRMLAKKYGGEFDYSVEGGVFTLRVLLPARSAEKIPLSA